MCICICSFDLKLNGLKNIVYNKVMASSMNTSQIYQLKQNSYGVTPSDYWKFIHLVCRIYNYRNRDHIIAVETIFRCLEKLLPVDRWKISLSQFLQEQPVHEFMEDSDMLFRWSYRLHQYVSYVKGNRQVNSHYTLEQLINDYSLITKPEWGKPFWNVMHNITLNLNMNNQMSNHSTLQYYKAFITSVNFILPCQDCKRHMTEFLAHNPLGSEHQTHPNLFMWTVRFHNEVNTRSNQKTISYTEAEFANQNNF